MAAFSDTSFTLEDAVRGKSFRQRLEFVPASRLLKSRFGRLPLFNSIRPSDLSQGRVGDCWLIAAISCLAEYPEEVESLFVGTAIDARERPPKGFEGFRYKPIFGKPETDIWALLIEKAFAKMIGSYPRLDGGHMLNAFRALTGCEEQEMWRPYDVGGSREWRNSLVVRGDLHARAHRGSARLQSPAFFGALESWSSSKYLIAASIRGRRREGRRRDGLVETHAYGVLACMQVGHARSRRSAETPPQALVQLRNPWGDHEWKGSWSKGSKEWSKHPAVAEALGMKNKRTDGTFYMSFSDFDAAACAVILFVGCLARALDDSFRPLISAQAIFTCVEVSHKAMRTGAGRTNPNRRDPGRRLGGGEKRPRDSERQPQPSQGVVWECRAARRLYSLDARRGTALFRYEDDDGWKRYAAEHAETLHVAASVSPTVTLSIRGSLYDVDLERMTQKKRATGFTRKIRKRALLRRSRATRCVESATRVVADASDAFGELRSGSLRPPADLCGGDAFGRLVAAEGASFVDDAHGGVVTSTRWAGEAILSTSDDRTVKLWRRDGASFALAWAGRGHGARCWHAPRPHHVVSCSQDGTAMLWATADGRRVATLTGHREALLARGARAAPARVVLATGGHDGAALLWSLRDVLATGPDPLVLSVPGPRTKVTCARILEPDAVLVCLASGAVWRVDGADGWLELAPPMAWSNGFKDAALRANLAALAGGDGGDLAVADAETGVKRIADGSASRVGVGVSRVVADAPGFATFGRDGRMTTYEWDADDLHPPRLASCAFVRPLAAVTRARDGLAAGFVGDAFVVVDVASGRCVARVHESHDKRPHDAARFAGRVHAASTIGVSTLLVARSPPGAKTLAAHPLGAPLVADGVVKALWLGDGRLLCAGGSGDLAEYDTKPLARARGLEPAMHAERALATRRGLAFSASTADLRIWRGRPLRPAGALPLAPGRDQRHRVAALCCGDDGDEVLIFAGDSCGVVTAATCDANGEDALVRCRASYDAAPVLSLAFEGRALVAGNTTGLGALASAAVEVIPTPTATPVRGLDRAGDRVFVAHGDQRCSAWRIADAGDRPAWRAAATAADAATLEALGDPVDVDIGDVHGVAVFRDGDDDVALVHGDGGLATATFPIR
ncbi:peptidase [Aureococcus anophagefferens]|nr:peptidase [Aureococcus anophagefferens]